MTTGRTMAKKPRASDVPSRRDVGVESRRNQHPRANPKRVSPSSVPSQLVVARVGTHVLSHLHVWNVSPARREMV